MSVAPSTFADFILLHARVRPNRPAIILADRVATYDMLAQGMLRAEARIRALSLKPSEPVCLTVESPIRHMIVAAALFRLGHPVLSAVDPVDIIPLGLPIATYLRDPGGALIPGVRQVLVDAAWFAGEPQPLPDPCSAGFSSEDAVCRIEITSGSTGRPKAVCSTVGGYNRRVALQHITINMGAWDRLLCLVGLNGAWGFRLAAHTLLAGKTLVSAEAPRQALEMIGVYKVDAMAASTQQARDLLAEQTRQPAPCGSLRAIVTGGGLPSRAMLLDLRARLCEQVFIQYASTEAGAMAFAGADKLMEVDGATGFVLPGAKIEIVDDADHPIQNGAEGIVRARTGWQATPWPPGSPHPGFREGWFYPGDRGRILPGGLLALSGRASEVINSGGVKRAPELIEDVVAAHPNVAEAGAFGAMGPDGIEEVHLAIVTREPIGEGPMIQWCAKAGLRVARVFIIDELPKTPMGKIRRDELKTRLMG